MLLGGERGRGGGGGERGRGGDCRGRREKETGRQDADGITITDVKNVLFLWLVFNEAYYIKRLSREVYSARGPVFETSPGPPPPARPPSG